MTTTIVPFSERAQFVGRQTELDLLKNYLTSRGENNYIYIYAEGGLGKTRLLQELQKMVTGWGSGFLSCGIIDLYHADLHGISDVERVIIDGIDPDKKYFPQYRANREQLELLRERGADSTVLEKRRTTLGKLFIDEMLLIAHEARKIVICFDTVELLQYESSVVEQLAGKETSDTRLKGWMVERLPQLRNVLIVFAGRPKRSLTEGIDHQERLIQDFKTAFGEKFESRELKPFILEETKTFADKLEPGVIPEKFLPVVEKLTGGRPIYLHLVIDRLKGLFSDARQMLEIFEKYSTIANNNGPEGELKNGREAFEEEMVRSIMAGVQDEMSGYLSRLAFMPKGFNAEILHQAMGLPEAEAQNLYKQLKNLSFVKTFEGSQSAQRLYQDRSFFHDELYILLTNPQYVPNLRINERQVAQAVNTNYYKPKIQGVLDEIEALLQDQTGSTDLPREKLTDLADKRSRLHKLQVECLYYQLVCDPQQGYREYKRLTTQANRDKQVGFCMRLLDEFLRFYNDPWHDNRRRRQCEAAGLTHDQVVRESVQTWMERFHWWEKYLVEISFAEQVFEQLEALHIRSQDIAILGNIYALWGRARAMKFGYEKEIVAEVKSVLEKMPPISTCDAEHLLALGRLETTVGYQYRQGGILDQAAQHTGRAIAAFRLLNDYREELSWALNNQAFIAAKQGDIALARSLVYDAMRIAHETHNTMSIVLNLTNQASIERTARQDYYQAIEYAQEALRLAQTLQSVHGIVRARINEGGVLRRLAEKDYERGRKLDEAYKRLENACESLEKGITEAESGGLKGEIPALQAELSKVYRSLGILSARKFDLERAMPYFRQGEQVLRKALSSEKWSIAEKGDLLEDLAELLFLMGDRQTAETTLQEVEKWIGNDALLIPGKHEPTPDTPNWYFLPLGQVERLRSEMAARELKYFEALQHYVIANVYFERFSPNAVEKNRMTEELYFSHLYKLSSQDRQVLLENIDAWGEKYNYQLAGVDLRIFLNLLGRMLGELTI